jgi:hypothetical protein
MWFKHEDFEDMIKSTWENRYVGDRGISNLWRQLQEVSANMKRWSFESFGSVMGEIKWLRSQLANA